MKSSNTPTTGNDNSELRARYYFTETHAFPDPEILWQHIPTAKELIQKFCVYPFKNDPTDPDYALMEYMLCTMLAWPHVERKFIIQDLAAILGQEPITLYNAPDFPVKF
jgi:hypothetical protein